MRILGPVDSPRERVCAQIVKAVLEKLVEAGGGVQMPSAVLVAFQWPAEDAPKVFIACDSQDSFIGVQTGVYKYVAAAMDSDEVKKDLNGKDTIQ